MPAEELVLVDHPPLRDPADALRREPVVPHERHALDERLVRANHSVEPPHVVVADRVERRERVAARVGRRGADQALGGRARQGQDGAAEALLHEARRFALARAEPGAPEETLGLGGPEGPLVDRHRHTCVVAPNGALRG